MTMKKMMAALAPGPGSGSMPMASFLVQHSQPMMPFRNIIIAAPEKKAAVQKTRRISLYPSIRNVSAGRRRRRPAPHSRALSFIQRNNSADVTRQGTSSTRNATTACDATSTTNEKTATAKRERHPSSEKDVVPKKTQHKSREG
eukprot:scaffold32125_cov124-Skeletonema_marinoi.AAC.1